MSAARIAGAAALTIALPSGPVRAQPARLGMALGLCLAPVLLPLACRGSTEPAGPAAPSLQATVSYEAGGTSQASGTWGTWCNWRTLDSTMHVLSLTAQATPTVSADTTRPALAYVSFAFRGRRFDEVPDDDAQRLGAGTTDTVDASAGTVSVPYHADSGTTRLRRLGGGYARVDFDAWYAPTYLPTAPRFRVAGYAEVPYLALCDLP